MVQVTYCRVQGLQIPACGPPAHCFGLSCEAYAEDDPCNTEDQAIGNMACWITSADM